MANESLIFDINFKNVATIFKKEFRSLFDSPIAYIVIVAFLSLLSWFYVSNIFLVNIASMRQMFEIAPVLLMFIAPAITMKLISEEIKIGTYEFLATKPVSETDITLGKFLAAFALLTVAVAPTLLYYFSLLPISDIDFGPVFGGYFGLAFLTASYVALGLFASSLTKNQIVAYIIGLFLIVAFYFFDKILWYLPLWLVSIFEYLGVDYHFENLARGVIDTRAIIYFLSLIGFALFLTALSLNKRKM